MYTIAQIVITAGIFALTLTIAGPAFPIVIIALVPVRLLLMHRIWDRETLRYVDRWACQEGTPEDAEDRAGMEVEVEVPAVVEGEVEKGTAS